MGIQNTELQQEKEITKNNFDRLLKLCDCLTSLGEDHDYNIARLTILCGVLLSATCALNKGSDDSTESTLCIVYQPDYCPTDEDRQISKLFIAAIGNEYEHKKISLSLIENQRLLIDTEAISKVGGWEYSIAQKKITYTPEVYRIYGVDLTFKMDELVNPCKDYSDSDKQIIKQAISDVLQNGKPYELESRFKSFDGVQKWVRIKGHPVYVHGKILKVSGNIVDITILRNLISNSIKYTNSGGLIEIKVTKHPHDVEFKISDNGVGMSKETQKKLFRIDTNVSTVGTSNEKGTGLGLILCVEFIEKLKGKICVESELGKGSTFIFTLPA